MSELVERLQGQFPQAVLGSKEFRGETTVVIRPEDLLAVGRFLRDEADLRYDFLTDVTSVDRLLLSNKGDGDSPFAGVRFNTVYQLLSIPHKRRLRLSVPCPGGDEPVVPSVVSLWPTANWHEREVYDLMGIRFQGHPDLRRILMPDNWQGHPLRKNEPVGGENVPFTVTWGDPEFASLGQQILPADPIQPALPKTVDTSRYMVLNMGPQHPATHGVLRLLVELDGEEIVGVHPDLGYLHSGFEKSGESKRYKDFVPYTDRMDYVSGMSNNLGYCLTVEKLLGIEVPPRAQAIRVIVAELQRLASHLVWLATHILDISGTIMSLLMYAFREREQIMDIFELICGARLTTSYIRIGGLWRDVPPAFAGRVREVLDYFPARIDEYERMLTDNPILRGRLEGIGKLTPEQAIALGCTGPMLRATGIPYDVRKVFPYSGYEKYDFEIPTATEGDCYARYRVRMAEMRQSLRIIRQALDTLPDGPTMTSDRKVALPPRKELDTSMEALIHHFKLVTEGFFPPEGEVYHGIESSKGELGFYIYSDGTPKPYRLHIRGPSFVNLQATDTMARGHLISDLVAIIGSIDIVLGEVDR